MQAGQVLACPRSSNGNLQHLRRCPVSLHTPRYRPRQSWRPLHGLFRGAHARLPAGLPPRLHWAKSTCIRIAFIPARPDRIQGCNRCLDRLGAGPAHPMILTPGFARWTVRLVNTTGNSWLDNWSCVAVVASPPPVTPARRIETSFRLPPGGSVPEFGWRGIFDARWCGKPARERRFV